MQKVIGGLLYDTDAAELAQHPRHIFDSSLYRTPNGRWFQHRVTPWEQDIWASTEEEARERLASDPRYAEFFGQPQPA